MRDTYGPMKLQGTDAIPAIRKQPNRREPFIQPERAILENGAGFGAELAFGVFELAFPAALIGHPARVFMSAGRTADAILPPKLDHCKQAHFWVRKMLDGIRESLRFLVKYLFHKPKIARNDA